jgi:tRNA U34 2-thiouridine synthase MnmA/TrmU
VTIDFIDSVESINPGQGVAVYSGNQLLGGGFIATVSSQHFLQV